MIHFHDIFLWFHYVDQRDRLIVQYADELRSGNALHFAVPTTWGLLDCGAVAREFSAALAGAGALNMAYAHTERLKGGGRVIKMYTIRVEAV